MSTSYVIIHTVLAALWLMLPAYFPNSTAALVKGNLPLDFGKNFVDGRRILGDGKTYRGFIVGAFSGILVGLFQNVLIRIYNPFAMPYLNIIGIICLSFGSMFGDTAASFVKRRIGLDRGELFPFVDQLDFVAGGWLLLLIFARDWFLEVFTLQIIIAALIITPLLHVSINRMAYKIGRKDVPW
ncbi:MAG: CDP-2,3-bis-(O-geranylgeranyl)-sn-glycerol synthase [Halobacteriota archaeon]|nr:CDP-2,3-bis-(O-geranylgeranyl)-sn-glycerol synthase [Halobacteriota archaeon]